MYHVCVCFRLARFWKVKIGAGERDSFLCQSGPSQNDFFSEQDPIYYC